MINLLPIKEDIYDEFERTVFSEFKKIRFGISGCSKCEPLPYMNMRKQLLDYQSSVYNEYMDLRISKLEDIIKCLRKDIEDIKENCCSGEPVCISPTITTQPVSGSVNQGGNITFTVQASGTAPLQYQWSRNNIDISGANSSSLILTNVQSAQSGSYRVVVSNSCGQVISSVANLNVIISVPVYFGWVPQSEPDYQDQINAFLANPSSLQGTVNIISGATLPADFRSNSVPAYLIAAEPISEPVKTKWFGTEINKGDISQTLSNPNADLFVKMTVQDNSNVNPLYRVYVSSYATQQTDTTLQLKVS